jgi:hypothetical protein
VIASACEPSKPGANSPGQRSISMGFLNYLNINNWPHTLLAVARFVVAHRTRDNHVLARLPIHRRSRLVLCGELDGDLVASAGRWVRS